MITTGIFAVNIDDWHHSWLEVARAACDCVSVLRVFGWKVRRGRKAMCLKILSEEMVMRKELSGGNGEGFAFYMMGNELR